MRRTSERWGDEEGSGTWSAENSHLATSTGSVLCRSTLAQNEQASDFGAEFAIAKIPKDDITPNDGKDTVSAAGVPALKHCMVAGAFVCAVFI